MRDRRGLATLDAHHRQNHNLGCHAVTLRAPNRRKQRTSAGRGKARRQKRRTRIEPVKAIRPAEFGRHHAVTTDNDYSNPHNLAALDNPNQIARHTKRLAVYLGTYDPHIGPAALHPHTADPTMPVHHPRPIPPGTSNPPPRGTLKTSSVKIRCN